MAIPRRRFCCDDDLARLGYDGLNAHADLQRWRDGRLHQPTQELIEVIEGRGVDGARLLDIGAGVGAVHVALLEAGAASAVDVDASREFLATARAEAERRGLHGRVEYVTALQAWGSRGPDLRQPGWSAASPLASVAPVTA